MFTLAGDYGDAPQRFKSAIEALPGKIAGLSEARVYIDNSGTPGNRTLTLTSTLADGEALAGYATHPEHLACVSIIKPYIAERACTDTLEPAV